MGDFEPWNNEPSRQTPKPDYHWLERKRSDRIKTYVKILLAVGILGYAVLRHYGMVR